MAKLLIKAEDAVHSDLHTDKQGCYKRGDVIAVVPDEHVWGSAEGLPIFLQLDVPSMPVSQVNLLIQDEKEIPSDFSNPVTRKISKLFKSILDNRDRKVTRRRKYSVDLTNIVFTDGKASLSSIIETTKRGI